MAELQAEEKKRADESEDKKRADEIQTAQIEKELKIKEMKLQASSATTPPPRNKDAKSPKVPSFIDEDELDSYLLRFECYAENAPWVKTHGLLS